MGQWAGVNRAGRLPFLPCRFSFIPSGLGIAGDPSSETVADRQSITM